MRAITKPVLRDLRCARFVTLAPGWAEDVLRAHFAALRRIYIIAVARRDPHILALLGMHDDRLRASGATLASGVAAMRLLPPADYERQLLALRALRFHEGVKSLGADDESAAIRQFGKRLGSLGARNNSVREWALWVRASSW